MTEGAAAWEARAGVETMRRLSYIADEKDRASLGERRAFLKTRDHAAVVYWQASELLEAIVPYLAAGLRAGDKVVYVADDLPIPAIESALKDAGINVAEAKQARKLELTSSQEMLFSNGTFDVDRAIANVKRIAADAIREGYTRVRLSVEMTYLLANVPGIERGPELESRANQEIFAEYPFVCICSFNGARNHGSCLEDVLATHPILISRGVPLANPHYRPWKLLREDPTAKQRWTHRCHRSDMNDD
jgi:hypothetical protein